jgi:hypothetical protein
LEKKDNLPQQLQEREYPNDRKPLAEIVMEGQFKKLLLLPAVVASHGVQI